MGGHRAPRTRADWISAAILLMCVAVLASDSVVYIFFRAHQLSDGWHTLIITATTLIMLPTLLMMRRREDRSRLDLPRTTTR